MNQGIAAARNGDYPLAIRYFEQARAIVAGEPDIYYNLGLAESRVPGHELRAMAWLGAYLASAVDAPLTTRDAVLALMENLYVKDQANISRLLELLEEAAGQIFSSLGTGQGEELSYQGDILTRDKKGKNLCDAARLWAESGHSELAIKIANNFLRGEYKRNALIHIVEAQAGMGDIAGARQTTGLLVSTDDTSWPYLSIVEAYVRNNDIEAATKTRELIKEAVPGQWAQHAIENGRPMVPGRYTIPADAYDDWLAKLDESDRTHICPLKAAPFLGLSVYLRSFLDGKNSQELFDMLRDTADVLVMAQAIIHEMMMREVDQLRVLRSQEEDKTIAGESEAVPAGKEYAYQGRQVILASERVFDITGKIKSADVFYDPSFPGVRITFQDDAKQALKEFSEQNSGYEAGFILNGRLVCVAVMRDPLNDGVLQITGGGKTMEELRRFASELSGK